MRRSALKKNSSPGEKYIAYYKELFLKYATVRVVMGFWREHFIFSCNIEIFKM